MKKKIKLIFFHPYSAIGGADNSLYRLINNLDRQKYSFTFISLNKSFLKKKLKHVHFINLNISRSIFSIIKLRKVIKKIISKNNDNNTILISNQNYANIVSYLSILGEKKIKTVFIERNHIDELFYYNSFYHILKNTVIFYLMKLVYPKVDRVIAISDGLKKVLIKNLKCGVELIYNPAFDDEIFKLSKLKTKFIFSKKKKYLITVSRFTKRKGIEDIVRAFNIVNKTCKNLHLLLIGYGDRENNIKKVITFYNLNKKVTIIKNCNNPYPYIKNCHLFIFNSKYEGFANVLVESIILNVPVISSNCNSGPSEILLNGKGGVLVPVKNNVKIIANEIKKFIKNDKKLIAKTKFAKTKVNRFKLTVNVKKFDKLFTDLSHV